MEKKPDCIIVHYDEIGIKGKNRSSFEQRLIKNIMSKCGGIDSAKRESGQVTLLLSRHSRKSLQEALSKIPGIAYFSFANKASTDFEILKKQVLGYVAPLKFQTFKIDTHRHNKKYPMRSLQVNELLGEAVILNFSKKVRLSSPDLVLKVEISDNDVYLSHESISGVGGLPTEPGKKVVSLLSGGFDSPVASYLMMKRGCEVVLVHFQNKNQASESVKRKILDIAKQLSKFQIKTKIYLVPFEEIQKQIIINSRAEARMLVYRRFMLRIASAVAELEKAKFLVVGDSLSQVASQTIENLAATYCVSEKHVLSPLIGLDKKEIIKFSREIGTYELSAQPYGDCCSYFLPKHPVLRADIKELEKIESCFDTEALVKDALKKARIKTLK